MGPLGISGLDKKTKIGISVSVAVVVVLVVMGFAIGILDCKKGYNRRKERRKNRRSELGMLELEIRSGQARQKRARESGLWDNLRSDGNDNVSDFGSLSVRKEDSLEQNTMGSSTAANDEVC
jgi:hypothetical protein